MTSDDQQALLQDAFRFLRIRSRSQQELVNYLQQRAQKRHISSILISPVIARLQELDYMNDDKFAYQWIESRSRRKGKGPVVLRQELKMKGIAQDVIDRALEKASLASTDSQYETAKASIQKKLPLWQKLPFFEFKKKLYEFLIRHGFSSSVASRLVDEYT